MYRDPTFHLFGLEFLEISITLIITVTITAALTFLLAYSGARRAQAGKPTGMQNFMEWIIEFIRSLVGDNKPSPRTNTIVMIGLTFIMFIFIGNFLSVPFKITTDNYYILWKSPTSDPHVTLAFSMMVIVLSNILGIRFTGAKAYFSHYFAPQWWLFPLHVLEEFIKTLTLGLRLFGNIFAKETLSGLIAGVGALGFQGISIIGAVGFLGMAVPMIIWQGFGIFMGAIQAFIFTILTLVYIHQKVDPDH